MVVYSGTGPSMYVMLARFDRLDMSDLVTVCFIYMVIDIQNDRPKLLI